MLFFGIVHKKSHTIPYKISCYKNLEINSKCGEWAFPKTVSPEFAYL